LTNKRPALSNMDNRLKDRIAVITGASSGIGKATALKFANSGAKIVCADLKSTGTEDEINAQHGKDRATFVACDVTDEKQIENLVKEAVAWGGRLDIICPFAGVALEHRPGASYSDQSTRSHDLDTDIFDKTLAINTRAVWLCCKHALRQFLEQKPRAPNSRGDRTRGWIVNVASIMGLVAGAGIPAYVASKHAVIGLTKQLAVDYAQDRIHVCIESRSWLGFLRLTDRRSMPLRLGL
jgi:NAD(P)-dependent dehydrogenase (short-subunit alcohol dehydrogenase family)